MINFLPADAWNSKWERDAAGRIYINLTGCGDLPCVLRELGGKLRGKDSPYIKGQSLDAFVDVLSDWFIDVWGDNVEVYIRGSKSITNIGSVVLPEITECFHSSFDNAAREAARVGSDCSYVDAKAKISIWFCFN